MNNSPASNNLARWTSAASGSALRWESISTVPVADIAFDNDALRAALKGTPPDCDGPVEGRLQRGDRAPR
jgi:hypothetical protein